MQIPVADQHRKHHLPGKIQRCRLTRTLGEEGGGVRVAVAPVLLLGELPQRLGEVFRVDLSAALGTVEPADQKCVSAPAVQSRRQVGDFFDGDQARFRRLDSGAARQRHHDELVQHHVPEGAAGKLHDPVAPDALRRDRRAAVFLEQRR